MHPVSSTVYKSSSATASSQPPNTSKSRAQTATLIHPQHGLLDRSCIHLHIISIQRKNLGVFLSGKNQSYFILVHITRTSLVETTNHVLSSRRRFINISRSSHISFQHGQRAFPPAAFYLRNRMISLARVFIACMATSR